MYSNYENQLQVKALINGYVSLNWECSLHWFPKDFDSLKYNLTLSVADHIDLAPRVEVWKRQNSLIDRIS